MKKGPESELLERYVSRTAAAGRQIGISGPAISEWPESRQLDAFQRRNEEADRLLGGIAKGAAIIALDETGDDISSAEFAKHLQSNLDGGTSEMAFVIGGPDGLDDAVHEASRMKLRFGRMTWPHQIARVMLTEQLYRSITIMTGHPYHRS
jgi:23S rRNA (pseudouridine1915-N3)-methyltransferase